MNDFKSGPMTVKVHDHPGGRRSLEVAHDVWDEALQAWQTVRWGVTAKGAFAGLEPDQFVAAVVHALRDGLIGGDLELEALPKEAIA